MNWLLIALISPVAHAFVNHFDKYLLSRYVKESSVGALLLFSSLFAVVALPILWWMNPNVLQSVTLGQGIALIANGALLMVAILFYLYALNKQEASYVVPLFQLIPVFGFFAGFLILHEVPALNQIWGGLAIVFGSIVLTLEFTRTTWRLKSSVLFLMIGSSVIYALNGVIFKFIALEQGFVDSLFWDLVGKVLFGIAVLLLVKPYRADFIGLIKNHGWFVIGLNSVNEVMGLVGEIAIVFAVLYAPVAVVQSVGGLQPLFVFLIGILITVFFPKFGQESLHTNDIMHKVVGIGIITVGLFFLY